MPWPKGVSGNLAGRPRKGRTWADELRALRSKTKKELIAHAVREAMKTGPEAVRWAEWLVKHSGESGSRDGGVEVNAGEGGTVVIVRDVPELDPDDGD